LHSRYGKVGEHEDKLTHAKEPVNPFSGSVMAEKGEAELYSTLEILTAARIMMFFWVVTPCILRLIGRYQSFGETYCLHFQSWWRQQAHVSPRNVSTSTQGAITHNNNIVTFTLSKMTNGKKTQVRLETIVIRHDYTDRVDSRLNCGYV
jgi:hypothetical protein